MRTGSLSLSIATGFVLGCSSARHEPFAVPEPVFFDTVKTIVLAPVAIPTGIVFAESRARGVTYAVDWAEVDAFLAETETSRPTAPGRCP